MHLRKGCRLFLFDVILPAVVLGLVAQECAQGQITTRLRDPALRQLDAIPVEHVEFEQASFRSVLHYLAEKAAEQSGGQPALRNIVVIEPPDGGLGDKLISLKLNSVPLSAVLEYVCMQADCSYRVDQYAIAVGRLDDLKKVALLGSPAMISRGGNGMRARLAREVVDGIEMVDADLNAVLAYLRQRESTAEPGVAESPTGPFNFLVKENAKLPVGTRPVSISLQDMPLLVVLDYVAELTGTEYRIDPYAVVFGEKKDLQRRPLPVVVNESAGYERLQQVVVKEIALPDSTLGDALDVIRYQSRDERNLPNGVNIINQASDPSVPLSLELRRVPLIVALAYVNELTDTRYRIESFAIVVEPVPEPKEDEEKKEELKFEKKKGSLFD